MPFEFNQKIVVTKDELVPHFYKSENTLKSQIQRHKDKPYGIKRIMIGGNGRQLLINFDSLPNEIKEGLGDPRKCDHIMERYYKVDPDAVRFFSMFKFDDGTYLTQDQQEKYIINASMLKSIIRLREARTNERKSKGGSLTGIAQTLLSDAISFNQTLIVKHRVEHTLPGSLPRFKAALKAFENEGYSSLISGKHKNANSRKVDDQTLKLLQNLFTDKKRKPTATEVHENYAAFIDGYIEVINNSTGEVYNPKGFKKLSVATVNNYLNSWSSKVATFQMRSDDRKYNIDRFKPFYSFDMPKMAGSIISIDDRQPPFKTLDGRRVWFYLGVDIASRAITTFVYGESKEGIILEFYRQMVRNYAEWGLQLPAELECEMSLNSSFTSTFLQEGAMFEFVKMEANNPRGKYIERVNEELRYRKEKKYEGWIARPKALKESNQPGIDTEKIKKLPYGDIIELCLREIEDWNNEEHPTEKGISRWDYFMQRQHPDLYPTNYKSFIKHIGIKRPSSCNLGNINLNNDLALIAENGEVAKGKYLIDKMSVIEGKEIDVYWIDDNSGNILKAYAYYHDEFVCELVQKPRPNRARKERSEKDAIAEQILAAYTNTVESFAKTQKSEIDEVVILDNRPKPERKFRIASLDRVRTENQYFDDKPAELLPSVGFDEIDNYTPSLKSLKDRF